MKRKINSKGFSVVEILLVLLVIGVVGGIGWYVYDRNKDDATNSSTTAKSNDDSTKAETDPTDKWLLYKAPDDAYTIRLADGWNLENTSPTDKSLYGFNSEDIDEEPGVKAVVTHDTGARDWGYIAFHVSVISDQNLAKTRGTKQTPLTTTQGLEVTKRVFTQQTEDPDRMDISKGSKEYTYTVKKGDKTIQIIHDETPEDTNRVKLVEQVIKTITL